MIKDLSGQKFGRLTAIKFVDVNHKNRKAMWICKCDCGNTLLVESSQLTSGNTKSCGCIKKDLNKTRAVKHGYYNSRLYKIWYDMKRRCYDKRRTEYKYYGGSGIQVCDNWLDNYINFYNWAKNNGYADNLTIERIDYSKNYCPENCKWIPQKDQTQNSRHNHFITFNNKTMTITQWSRELGINRKTIRERLNKGWKIENVLSPQKYTGYNTNNL